MKRTQRLKNYHHASHSKYLLQYHLVFATKYRKKLLEGVVKDDIKQIIYDIANEKDLIIKAMETDIDHIHIMVDAPPTKSVVLIVNNLKAMSTNRIYKKHRVFLKGHFWKENTFWSDGYFACSIGEASPETIKKYIQTQG